MHCPACSSETDVIETRLTADASAVRRRRRCVACAWTFGTLELPREEIIPMRTAHRLLSDLGVLDLPAAVAVLEAVARAVLASAEAGPVTRPADLDLVLPG